MTGDNRSKPGLGSAKMSAEDKRRIQSLGGQQSPQNFAKNPQLARKAGKEGGSK